MPLDMDYIDENLSDADFSDFNLNLDVQPLLLRYTMWRGRYKLGPFDRYSTMHLDSPVGVYLDNGLFVDGFGSIVFDILKYFDIENAKKIIDSSGITVDFLEDKIRVVKPWVFVEYNIEYTHGDGNIFEKWDDPMQSFLTISSSEDGLIYNMDTFGVSQTAKRQESGFLIDSFAAKGFIVQDSGAEVFFASSLYMNSESPFGGRSFVLRKKNSHIHIYRSYDAENYNLYLNFVKLKNGCAIYNSEGVGVIIEKDGDDIVFYNSRFKEVRRIAIEY